MVLVGEELVCNVVEYDHLAGLLNELYLLLLHSYHFGLFDVLLAHIND